MHKRSIFFCRSGISWPRLAAPVLIAVATPSVCHADLGNVDDQILHGGSPLDLFNVFEIAATVHFVFGSLFIGFVEACFLVYCFKTRRPGTLLLMIFANYISSIAYVFVVSRFEAPLDPMQCASGFFVAFGLTVILEAPFVLLCFEAHRRSARQWLTATLLTQLASYGVILAYYWWWLFPVITADAFVRERLGRGLFEY